MPTVITQGAASAKGYGFGASAAGPVYIEDVFSTYLYTGTGASQTITNGINLSSKGGLVWIKGRTFSTDNALYDTARGATFDISSNLTAGQTTQSTGLTSFGTTGFTIGSLGSVNTNTAPYVSWTFREQAKFFDVVTYTGTGVARTIAHNLASVPGCVMVKRTDTAGDWKVYHNAFGAGSSLVLNTSDAAAGGVWNGTLPTSSVFSVGTDATVNASGGTYVAYLFANDAGGFGANGTDNIISCGNYLGNGSATGPTITLGYEPQFIIIKNVEAVGAWLMFDNMRGMPVGSSDALLVAQSASGESSSNFLAPTATGFKIESISSNINTNGVEYLYIAIRRGPMKAPTTGTSVFGLSARTGTGANATVTGGQIADAILIKNRGAAVADLVSSRLSGTGYLVTTSTAAEVAAGATILQANPWDVMNGAKVGTTSTITNASANTFINYLFRRAPGFFDVVCYTGPGGTSATISHNLGVVPELIIVKSRSRTGEPWPVYAAATGNTKYGNVYSDADFSVGLNIWDNTTPTSSVFSVSSSPYVNSSGSTYIAYLFATVAGVSKVGSYTGTGTTLQVNCGFTTGARFVLIKRTDSTGDWYVWDTARGIVAGNDPYLLLNSTAAEVTSTDYVDTYSAGFEISSTAPAAINANGGTFIFLAIA